MVKDGRIWLSHTGVESLERCPRCFWLSYRRKIRQPEGIVSRLANRFDTVLKNYFNMYRPDLPPMVEGKLQGRLQNPFVEKYFVTIDAKYGFWGKLDECLVDDQNQLVPIDFKTSSSDPREKETLAAYQAQIDAYIYLLSQKKQNVADIGYLIYVYPDLGKYLHRGFPMVVHLVKLKGDPDRTVKRIARAIEILEGRIPKASSDCDFCAWYDKISEELAPRNLKLIED